MTHSETKKHNPPYISGDHKHPSKSKIMSLGNFCLFFLDVLPLVVVFLARNNLVLLLLLLGLILLLSAVLLVDIKLHERCCGRSVVAVAVAVAVSNDAWNATSMHRAK